MMNKIINVVIALCIVGSPAMANPPEEESVPPEVENSSFSAIRELLTTEIDSILSVENPEAGTHFNKIVDMLNTAGFHTAHIQHTIDERTSAFEAELSWDEGRNQKCREIFGEWVQKGQDLISKYSECHESRFELAAKYHENIVNGKTIFDSLRQLRADDAFEKCMHVDESDPTLVSLCRSKFLSDLENMKQYGRPAADSYVESEEKLKILMDEVEKDATCPHSNHILPEGLPLFLIEGESIVRTAIKEGGCSAGRW